MHETTYYMRGLAWVTRATRVAAIALIVGVPVMSSEAAGKTTVAQVEEFSAGLNLAATLNVAIAAGPNGNLWFTDKGTNSKATDSRIGMIDPKTGAITEFSIAGNGGNPGSAPTAGIVAGPDGNVWFTDDGTTPAIGEYNSTTHMISEWSIAANGGDAGSNPMSITVGPDGNLWFTDRGAIRAIGMIDPTTHAINEFSTGLNQMSLPGLIAVGPDGNLWFTDSANAGGPPLIGRISPTTRTITTFTSGLNAGANPGGIATGPDGNLWFTDNGTIKAIGKIAPATGAITEFSSLLPAVTSMSGNTLTLSQAATASGTATLQFSTHVTMAVATGSNTALVAGSASNLAPGMETSSDFPAGTTVLSISGNTLTLSAAATQSVPANIATFSVSVAGVTTTTGSPTVSVPSGGFPLVATDDSVSGPGIPVGILNPGASPLRIVAGPDGKMWFSDAGAGVTPATPAIGMINPATHAITEFTQPAGMSAGSHPQGIAVGPDRNIYFTDAPTSPVSPEAIGRIGVDPSAQAKGTGPRILVAADGRVQIFDAVTHQLRRVLAPFGSAYLGPISVAVGTSNGESELAVGEGPGGSPLVKLLNGRTGRQIASFMTFPASFRGGVSVSLGDLEGNGTADLIVGSGAGIRAQVKVYSAGGNRLVEDLESFGPSFTGGVSVAAGDLTGTEAADLIVGTGPGASAQVKVYSGATSALLESLTPFAASFQGGVLVAAGDLAGSDKADLIVGSGVGRTSVVKAYAGTTKIRMWAVDAFSPSYTGGVSLASVPLDGASGARVVVGLGVGANSEVKILNGKTARFHASFLGIPGSDAISLAAG